MKAALVFLFAASVSAAAPKKVAAPRYGFQKIPPGKVWVSSVPVGLEVFAGPKAIGQALDSKPLGRTPLLVDAKVAGPHVTVKMDKKEYGDETLPYQMDFLDFTAKTNLSFTRRVGDKDEDIARGLTYAVDGSKPIVIALFQTRTMTLPEWAHRYPLGRNFSFREDALRKDLAIRGVPRPFVDSGVDLLRRGGKSGFPARDGWVVAEVQPSGDVSVFTPPPPPTPRTTSR